MMRSNGLALTLSALLTAGGSAETTTTTNAITFTALTQPLPLYPGEVTNSWQRISIPPGPIAISEFSADIVERDVEGQLIPVPLGDAYLRRYGFFHSKSQQRHHWWGSSSSSSPKNVDIDADGGVGFGAGAESRGTPQVFPHPFRFTTVLGEDELVANVHIINTRSMTTAVAQYCSECPCTQEDYAPLVDTSWHWPWTKNPTKNRDITAPNMLKPDVIARKHDWGGCNDQLRNESNSACSPSSYRGGLLCCEHGEFCLDEYFIQANQLEAPDPKTNLREASKSIREAQSVFFLRYTLMYQPLTPKNASSITPLYLASCCDATGNSTSIGNIEYDIPKLCGSGESCVHTLQTIQEIGGTNPSASSGDKAPHDGVVEDKWVDVVSMVGHLVPGGMEISAYFANNDTLLCRSLPHYGTGQPREIGNEPGYINAMSTCTFDPPKRMKTAQPLKIVAKYNASQAHTGVTSLFFLAVAAVMDDNKSGTVVPTTTTGGFLRRFQRLATLVALAILVTATMKVHRSHRLRREGYEQISSLVV